MNEFEDLEIKEVLTEDVFTFGKYKDLGLETVLRDRKYCNWLVQQDWFEKQYEYLYNRVLKHCPRKNFIMCKHLEIKDNIGMNVEEFIEKYEYFHMTPLEELKLDLTKDEKNCYSYYLSMIDSLKNSIIQRKENGDPNPYNIKAPKAWLKKLEKIYDIPRSKFKDFLSANELPNLPYIIQDIKEIGGIEYKGAKSFLIAKKRSEKQELFWEEKLKEKYGEDIGTQFKFRNCIFDMINISTRTLYECKLGLKDFNEDQHRKYMAILRSQYKIVYLIGTDCVIDMENRTVYTTDVGKYYAYILSIPMSKNPSKFDLLIQEYKVVDVPDVVEYI